MKDSLTLTEIDWANGNDGMPETVQVPSEFTKTEESIEEYLTEKFGDTTCGYVGSEILPDTPSEPLADGERKAKP